MESSILAKEATNEAANEPGNELDWESSKRLGKSVHRLSVDTLLDGKDRVNFDTIAKLIAHMADFRLHSMRAIFLQFEQASQQDVLGYIWGVHAHVHNLFKLAADRLSGISRQREKRKVEKVWFEFLHVTREFHRGFISRLSVRFNVGPVRQLALSLGLDVTQTDYTDQPPSGQAVVDSAYVSLVRMGDLRRYQHRIRRSTRLHQDATADYEMAAELRPECGHAYHQLAMLAQSEQDHLKVLYYLYRALAADSPHLLARANLEYEFKAVRNGKSAAVDRAARKGKGAAAAAGMDAGADSPTAEALLSRAIMIKWFVRLHGELYHDAYRGAYSSAQDELENEIMNRIKTAAGQKNHEIARDILDMTLSNIAAYHVAARKANDLGTDKARNTKRGLMRLNLRFVAEFFSLLAAELSATYDSVSRSDWDLGDDSKDPTQLEESAMFTVHHILPSARIYVVWLISYHQDLVVSDSDRHCQALLEEAYRSLARAGNLVMSLIVEPMLGHMRTAPYLLQEDRVVVGLAPLTRPDLPVGCRVGYFDRGVRKPHRREYLGDELSWLQMACCRVFDMVRGLYFLGCDDNIPFNAFVTKPADGSNSIRFSYGHDESNAEVDPFGGPITSSDNDGHDHHSDSHDGHPEDAAPIGGPRDFTFAELVYGVDPEVNAHTPTSAPTPAPTPPQPQPAVRQASAPLDAEAEASLMRRLAGFISPPEWDGVKQKKPAAGGVSVSTGNHAAGHPAGQGTFPTLPWDYFIKTSPIPIGHKHIEDIFQNAAANSSTSGLANSGADYSRVQAQAAAATITPDVTASPDSSSSSSPSSSSSTSIFSAGLLQSTPDYQPTDSVYNRFCSVNSIPHGWTRRAKNSNANNGHEAASSPSALSPLDGRDKDGYQYVLSTLRSSINTSHGRTAAARNLGQAGAAAAHHPISPVSDHLNPRATDFVSNGNGHHQFEQQQQQQQRH